MGHNIIIYNEQWCDRELIEKDIPPHHSHDRRGSVCHYYGLSTSRRRRGTCDKNNGTLITFLLIVAREWWLLVDGPNPVDTYNLHSPVTDRASVLTAHWLTALPGSSSVFWPSLRAPRPFVRVDRFLAPAVPPVHRHRRLQSRAPVTRVPYLAHGPPSLLVHCRPVLPTAAND